MYGMVNLAFKGYIKEKYSSADWDAVVAQSGIPSDDFINLQQYPDDQSVAIVVASAKQLGKEVPDMLVELGIYWIEFAYKSDYGSMLDMAGKTLPDVLSNLDSMHARIGNSMPELKPPSFWCTRSDAGKLLLHYVSPREGLASFVEGLLIGLGKRLHNDCSVVLLESKSEGAAHDIFEVSYS